MDEDQRLQLLGLFPERIELGCGDLLAVDAAADGGADEARTPSCRVRAARRRAPETARTPARSRRSGREWPCTSPRAFRSGRRRCGGRGRGRRVPERIDAERLHVDAVRVHVGDASQPTGKPRLPLSWPSRLFHRVPLTRSSTAGTAQCACTSTVRTRRPPTVTSRRVWAARRCRRMSYSATDADHAGRAAAAYRRNPLRLSMASSRTNARKRRRSGARSIVSGAHACARVSEWRSARSPSRCRP